LSSEELAILAELLASERTKLLIEIRHTDHRAVRDQLRGRLTLVESLVERCGFAMGASPEKKEPGT
jgi:erythromycin esterase-like protein